MLPTWPSRPSRVIDMSGERGEEGGVRAPTARKICLTREGRGGWLSTFVAYFFLQSHDGLIVKAGYLFN